MHPILRSRSGSTTTPAPIQTWTARLPEDIVYQIIDDHLSFDLPTLKSLCLTSAALGLHCRKFVFRSIELGTLRANSDEAKPKKSQTARFAALLKQSPEIAGFVHELEISAFPKQQDLPSFLERLSFLDSINEGKALISILSRRFKSLREVRLENKSTKWDDIPLVVQYEILRLFGNHRLQTVVIALRSFPTVLLEHLRGNLQIALCGELYKGSCLSPLGPDPGARATITGLKICHVPDRSMLTLVGSDGPPPVDFSGSKGVSLFLGRLPAFSVGCHRLVQACRQELEFLNFDVDLWDYAVPVDLWSFPSLEGMNISVETASLDLVLEWLSKSLEAVNTNESKAGGLSQIALSIYTHDLPDDDTAETHQRMWAEASKKQDQWPGLNSVEIRGFSQPVNPENGILYLTCLGSYKDGGHVDGEDDEHHHH
ncbi:hypothetical protein FA15DRAFT_262311 [Coprinopsis marcescibilis]|uniref:F-box domain-containing protein n=1 Tax=Coprinopsis marcescibilis TaxID=230819 RepID=A0A5C3KDY4_COPMA|nr:hypothetical protein FA15DRAFT_262311 [Coprinopsis marcescibilis]